MNEIQSPQKGLFICLLILFPFILTAQSYDAGVAFFDRKELLGDHFFSAQSWTANGPSDPWGTKIESLRVPKGWEIWVYNNFKFQGEYLALKGNWNGSGPEDWQWRGNIKSMKIVRKPSIDDMEDAVDKASYIPQGQITVFNEKELKGKSFTLVENWTSKGPEDIWSFGVQSILIPSGWEVWVYKDYNFKGEYMSLGSNWLGSDDNSWLWVKNIKSIRVVRQPQIKKVVYVDPGPVVVYEHSNFSGEKKELRKSWTVGGAEGLSWNDKISSIRIPKGVEVIIFEHSNFGGKSQKLLADWTVSGTDEFWNDQISSLQIKYPPKPDSGQ